MDRCEACDEGEEERPSRVLSLPEVPWQFLEVMPERPAARETFGARLG